MVGKVYSSQMKAMMNVYTTQDFVRRHLHKLLHFSLLLTAYTPGDFTDEDAVHSSSGAQFVSKSVFRLIVVISVPWSELGLLTSGIVLLDPHFD